MENWSNALGNKFIWGCINHNLCLEIFFIIWIQELRYLFVGRYKGKFLEKGWLLKKRKERKGEWRNISSIKINCVFGNLFKVLIFSPTMVVLGYIIICRI